MSKPILVGFDPRSRDRAPVDFGAAFATLTGAPLIIATVEARAPVLAVSEGQALAYGVVDRDLLDDADEAVEELEEELRTRGIRVDERRLRDTSAARALHVLAEQEDAGLLVVGSDRRAGAGRIKAGTTGARLLHGSPCPVAVVPQAWTGAGFGTIGVAYVDSDEGREALRGAHALAHRAGATLRAITVVAPGFWAAEGTEPSIAGRAGKNREDVEGEHKLVAERSLRRAVEELGGDVAVEVEALVGDPVELLVSVSEHLDLLVCGSRGYGPVRAVLLGSVSSRVVAAARCAVIAVPRGVKASLEAMLTEPAGAVPRA